MEVSWPNRGKAVLAAPFDSEWGAGALPGFQPVSVAADHLVPMGFLITAAGIGGGLNACWSFAGSR